MKKLPRNTIITQNAKGIRGLNVPLAKLYMIRDQLSSVMI